MPYQEHNSFSEEQNQETGMERFKEKVAVVTGGGSGIGAAIATRLAAEGATVAIIELETERGQETVDAIKAADG
ncbi:SDR family NAD(P)-dependent oxidoreductase, partial [Rubripirellula obstinata]|uniref:SDR family NAD(P)-dependent oxidoreductase n=1 Tax=Rubripirellula obstinata TaxID=406547 RepID=UPI001EE3EEC2